MDSGMKPISLPLRRAAGAKIGSLSRQRATYGGCRYSKCSMRTLNAPTRACWQFTDGWLISVGVLHTGIAYTLMYSAYPRLTTPVISVLAFVFPLVSILLDWIAYSNPNEPSQAAGVSLIMLRTLGVQLGWHLPKKSKSCWAS